MPYIDATYYNETYKGKTAAAETLAVFLERATDIIDQMTHYQIVQAAGGLSSFSPFIQDQVKKATAAQTEFLIMSGSAAANQGIEPVNVSIGSFSYSGAGATQQGSSSGRTTPAVIEYLKPTGLLYAGVDVRSYYPPEGI
jgi:hypothetical protein